MKPPRIYSAISAISRELARTGVAKSSTNADDGYAFRGVDEVMCALAPLLAKHRICVLPRLTERWCEPTSRPAGSFHVTVKGAFDLVSAADGSKHTLETYGESIDASDKGTSKAMTAAYKYALLQAFCVPVRGTADPDLTSPKPISAQAEPVQGWSAWASDVAAVIGGCETIEAVDRAVATYGSTLRAMATAKRPEYSKLGEVIRQRKQMLMPAQTASKQLNGSTAHAA